MPTKNHKDLVGVDLHITKDYSVGPVQAQAGLGRYEKYASNTPQFTANDLINDGLLHIDGLNFTTIFGTLPIIAIHLMIHYNVFATPHILTLCGDLAVNATSRIMINADVRAGIEYNVEGILIYPADGLFDYLSDFTAGLDTLDISVVGIFT